MVAGYPMTLQLVRESVPRHAWRHGDVNSAAYVTTGVMAVTFTINTLLYLIPIAKDVWYDGSDPMSFVFRIILPVLLYFFMLIFVRVYPMGISRRMENSMGFDQIDGKVVVFNAVGV